MTGKLVEKGMHVRRRTVSYCDSEHHAENRRAVYTKPAADTRLRCHQLADSLLSTSSGFNNYRGFLNLGIILLALLTGRVALENVIKYGILIDPFMWMRVFINDPYSWPSFCLVLLTNFFILYTFAVELLLSTNSIGEALGSLLHAVNLFAAITFPALVVLFVHPSPLTSSPVLTVYIVMFLKLISYKDVNKWCREASHGALADKSKRSIRRAKSCSHNLVDFHDPYAAEATVQNQDTESLQVYPQNVNLRDLYYFMVVPTLCYELNFPRTTRIRKRFLVNRIIEMVFLCGLMLALIQQWIIPAVHNSMVPFQELRLSSMVERLLKLAVPNHLIWLIFFYWLFHSSLNVAAELTRFGDRVFYKDWWNAETVQTFWQTWNIPVHKWALRHLYKPMLTRGFSKTFANVAVFFVSAFFHEYLVSIPLQMFRLWAFAGLLGQIPLVMLTNKWIAGGKYGNMVVWLSLIMGQPIAILMYYHDYYVLNTHT